MKFWIGPYIRNARMRKGITQQELAKLIGRRQSYLSKVESGRLQPGFHEVLDVLQMLGAQPPPWNAPLPVPVR